MIKHIILTIVIVALLISPIHAEDDAFTIPDGSGEVVEYINDTVTRREFYTVKTTNDNVFYLIIDKEKSSGNVYFLTDADESDLIEFVKDKSQSVREAAVPVETEAPPIVEPEPTVEKSPNRAPLLMMVVFIAVAGGGAYWYFKIRKPTPVSGILSANDDDFDDNYEETINEDEDDLI